MSMMQTRQYTAPDFAASRWRWSRAGFQHIADLGVFSENEHVELIDGEIISRTPPNPEHSGCVNPAADLISAAFGDGAYVRKEQPMIVNGITQPQPDVLVCRGSSTDYRRRFPTGANALLAVEIADSSLEKDRVKGAVYATADLPEYWIVDLRARCLEVYRKPDGVEYLSRRIYRLHESVSPLSAPQSSIAVANLFGE